MFLESGFLSPWLDCLLSQLDVLNRLEDTMYKHFVATCKMQHSRLKMTRNSFKSWIARNKAGLAQIVDILSACVFLHGRGYGVSSHLEELMSPEIGRIIRAEGRIRVETAKMSGYRASVRGFCFPSHIFRSSESWLIHLLVGKFWSSKGNVWELQKDTNLIFHSIVFP